jgi:peroxiredoxin
MPSRPIFEAGKPPYRVPRSVIDTMHRATDELIASGAATQLLKAGNTAASFVLNDPDSRPVSSAGLLAQGPLVISFYRGIWCPYCNMELQALQEALPAFRELDANLVAISPQSAISSHKSRRTNGLDFTILPDPANETAAAFGLSFALPDYLIKLCRSPKNDLPAFNRDTSWTLPMPLRDQPGRSDSLRRGQPGLHTSHHESPFGLLFLGAAIKYISFLTLVV